MEYNIMRELRVPPAYKVFDDATEQWLELRRQAVACLLQHGMQKIKAATL